MLQLGKVTHHQKIPTFADIFRSQSLLEKVKMKRLLPIILLAFLVNISCNRDKRTEDEIIEDFIAENNLTGEFMQDGIFVSIENPGNGDNPNADDSVEVLYEGKRAINGDVFDSRLANPITFPLSGVIPGWTKGIPYFGVGDKGWLILPAAQGYGSFPPPGSSIKSGDVLAFYIELISIQ